MRSTSGTLLVLGHLEIRSVVCFSRICSKPLWRGRLKRQLKRRSGVEKIEVSKGITNLGQRFVGQRRDQQMADHAPDHLTKVEFRYSLRLLGLECHYVSKPPCL